MTRLVRVGFEVRLTVRPAGLADTSHAGEIAAPGEEEEVTVFVTRSHARELELEVGSRVWLAANSGSLSVQQGVGQGRAAG